MRRGKLEGETGGLKNMYVFLKLSKICCEIINIKMTYNKTKDVNQFINLFLKMH